MSDTFWVQIFLVLMFVAKAVLDELRQTRLREYNLRLEEHNARLVYELHANTVETIKGNEEVSSKLDSATRETTTNSKDARAAAIFAAEKVTKIETTANDIVERLNGGDQGLGNRISKNEARLDSLEKGQRSHDEAIGSVARAVEGLLMEFHTFAVEYKANNVDRSQVRGESR